MPWSTCSCEVQLVCEHNQDGLGVAVDVAHERDLLAHVLVGVLYDAEEVDPAVSHMIQAAFVDCLRDCIGCQMKG